MAKRLLVGFALLILAYAVIAYVALPALLAHHEHQPGLAALPMVTRAAGDVPGDPLNVGLVGTETDVIRAMHAAGWVPADPITLRSSIAIVGSVLFDRAYQTAPVSPLYYDGRHEDLAYEKPVGENAKQRHHVRLWKVLDDGAEGRPVWLGSATFDRGVGLSAYTGQVTHDIAADIDAERGFIVAAIEGAGMVQVVYQVTGVGPTLAGRNGEGDLYRTDGEIWIMSLVEDGRATVAPPRHLLPPPLVGGKDALWRLMQDQLGG